MMQTFQSTVSLARLRGLLPRAPVLFGAVNRAEAKLLRSGARSRGWSRAGLAVGLCHSKASSADCQWEKSAGTAWLDAGRAKRNVSLLLAPWIVLSVLLLPDTPAWWTSWQRSSSASASGGAAELLRVTRKLCGAGTDFPLGPTHVLKTGTQSWGWLERDSTFLQLQPYPWDSNWAAELEGLLSSQRLCCYFSPRKMSMWLRAWRERLWALRLGLDLGMERLSSAHHGAKLLAAFCPEAVSPVPTLSRAQLSQDVMQNHPPFFCS